MTAQSIANSSLVTRWTGPAVALLALLVFSRVLVCGFINFDDDTYVYRNSMVLRGLTAEGIAWAFTDTRTGNRHPVTWLSLMIDAQIARGIDALTGRAADRPNPLPFHLTNLLLHAANAWLVCLILRTIFQLHGDERPLVAAVLAAIWAIHPLRVESVAWISERKDVLSAFFGLLAIHGYLRRRWMDFESDSTRRASRPWGIAPTTIWMALSLLCKPMLVTLPLLLLLLDFWPLRRRPSIGLLIEKLPLLAMSLLGCWMAMEAQRSVKAEASWELLPWNHRVDNAVVSYARYLLHLAVPSGLTVFYPHPEQWPRWVVWVSLATLAVISAACVALRRGRPGLLVGWLWFCGLLVPVIGIIQVGSQSMADRYTYLPMIGVSIALGAVWPRIGQRATAAAGGALTVALAAAAWTQIGLWRDSVTLFEHAVRLHPHQTLSLNNLATGLLDSGRIEPSIPLLEESLQLNPRGVNARNNLGFAYASLAVAARNRGDQAETARLFDLAVETYLKCLQVKPDFAQCMTNLGVAYAESGRLQDAAAWFNQSILTMPDYAPAYHNLGITLIRLGLRQEGIEMLRRGVRIDPSNLAARQWLDKAVELERKLAP